MDYNRAERHYLINRLLCKFQEITVEEINKRKMVILIPFALLRVRELLKKKRSAENKEKLKAIIQNDIIGSIDENLKAGNITEWDARRLKRYTHKLYEEVYSHYEGMEELNMLTDESLILDVDIMEKKFEEAEKRYEELEKRSEELEKRSAELEKQNAEKDKVFVRKNKELERKDKEITRKDEELNAKDKEIERLKTALAKAGICV